MVVKVLNRPAWIPFGGSTVHLMAICNKESGNSLFGSQVIQSLNSGWKVLSLSPKISSILAMKSRLKWQLESIAQRPVCIPASMSFIAGISYSSPIETASTGYFLCFLAYSLIGSVGSAPADKRYRTGLCGSDSDQISAI